MFLYHNYESVTDNLVNLVSSKKVETLKPEAITSPSPSSTLTGWLGTETRMCLSDSTLSCLLRRHNDIIMVKLTPGKCFVHTYMMTLEHWLKNIQLPVFKESRQVSLDECTESGGQHSLLLWQTISRILRCCWSARVPGFLSICKRSELLKHTLENKLCENT